MSINMYILYIYIYTYIRIRKFVSLFTAVRHIVLLPILKNCSTVSTINYLASYSTNQNVAKTTYNKRKNIYF